MSRTWAHRPHWAHFADPDVCVPSHDHRAGHCDLPALPDWLAEIRAGTPVWRTHTCTWEIPWYRIPPSCGCPRCTGADDRRADRRADRHDTAAGLARHRGQPAATVEP